MSRGSALPIAFAVFFGIINGIAIFKPLIIEERLHKLEEQGIVPPEVEKEPLEKQIDILEKVNQGQPPPVPSTTAAVKELQEKEKERGSSQPKQESVAAAVEKKAAEKEKGLIPTERKREAGEEGGGN
ncbi:hypothetical protein RUND412_002017 [Rhizina undulata]